MVRTLRPQELSDMTACGMRAEAMRRPIGDGSAIRHGMVCRREWLRRAVVASTPVVLQMDNHAREEMGKTACHEVVLLEDGLEMVEAVLVGRYATGWLTKV